MAFGQPDLPKSPGLYLFEVATSDYTSFDEWLLWYRLKWEDPLYKEYFVPNFKKKRINLHSTLLDKMPLYLGQAENINKRIWEHIYLKLERNTVALKLNERALLFGTKFYLSVIELKVENTRIILPEIEAVLRKKINPLVGRQ